MICDETAQIDIRKLARSVPTIPDVIEFDGERIVTTWTSTNFGGCRQWFLCPTCDRRCAIIYRLGNGPLWCCRICGGGRYRSEHESPKARKLRKALKVRKRLGQEGGGLLTLFPSKPKGMHPLKYGRLREHAMQFEREILIEDLAGAVGKSVEVVKANLALPSWETPLTQTHLGTLMPSRGAVTASEPMGGQRGVAGRLFASRAMAVKAAQNASDASRNTK